jgi:uncharacterized protein with NAD-binding domain and iron-sulfur cluster
MVDYITAHGGQVLTGEPIYSIDLNDDNSVKRLVTLDDGTQATANVYVSAMPVDVLKRLIPSNWSQMPYFCQLKELEGIPVINIQVSHPCHAMPCHAMPCHAMPCHAMPCHAMPCHAMPCLRPFIVTSSWLAHRTNIVISHNQKYLANHHWNFFLYPSYILALV